MGLRQIFNPLSRKGLDAFLLTDGQRLFLAVFGFLNARHKRYLAPVSRLEPFLLLVLDRLKHLWVDLQLLIVADLHVFLNCS